MYVQYAASKSRSASICPCLCWTCSVLGHCGSGSCAQRPYTAVRLGLDHGSDTLSVYHRKLSQAVSQTCVLPARYVEVSGKDKGSARGSSVNLNIDTFRRSVRHASVSNYAATQLLGGLLCDGVIRGPDR